MQGRLQRSLKEIARHLYHSFGLRRSYDHLKPSDRGRRFSLIYKTGVWAHGDPAIPSSGHGSSLAATVELRTVLPSLLKELGSEVLLDVGCGDFTWMQETDLSCTYVGVDIVESVIAANHKEFSSEKRSFLVLDAVTDELPEADTVLCREVLFHLSLEDGLSAIRNLLSKQRKFLIMTSDRDTFFNSDIETGDFRILNLQEPPFRFPEPFFEIGDSAVARRRILGFWKTSDIARANLHWLKIKDMVQIGRQ